LETDALLLLTLSTLTFAELRSRAISLNEGINGAAFLLISVVLSCLSSLLSEWVLKPKYCPGNMQRFYLQKVRLEVWGIFTSAIVLYILTPSTESVNNSFDGWDTRMSISLTVRVVQSWMAGVLAKHFSTVAKAVIQCLSLLLVFFLGDMWIFHTSTSNAGSLPICVLAVVVALSTLLYQMGRDKTVKQALREAREERRAEEAAGGPEEAAAGATAEGSLEAGTGELAGFPCTRSVSDNAEYGPRARALLAEGPRGASGPSEDGASFIQDGQVLSPHEFSSAGPVSHHQRVLRQVSRTGQSGLLGRSWLARARLWNASLAEWLLPTAGLISQLACVGTFIVSDASRTIVYDRTINHTAIVQQSIVIMMSVASIPIGVVIAGIMEGPKGVKASMSPKMALKYLPVSACFSLGQTCQIYAYGVGISGVMNTVIGYSYMPLSAVLSRWIFRRVYTHLEWLALLLLVLSASCFVLMQDNGSGGVSILGIVFVLISVVLSCLGSVLAEKFMKDDRDSPFYIQKVQLEVGGMITATVMLFVSGLVSNRPTDAFWKDRDIGGGTVDHGVFVAWDAKITLALVVSLLQSWLGGLVAKQLSTVIRAVAQCLSLLLIYFVGDLVLKKVPFDWPQGTTAVVVALTVQVFSQARPPSRPPDVEVEPPPEDESAPEDESESEGAGEVAGSSAGPFVEEVEVACCRAPVALPKSAGPTRSMGSALSTTLLSDQGADAMRSSTGGSS